MTTKQEAIAALKKQYSTLKSGSDEQGYTDLSPADYEATIAGWADNQLADEAKALEGEQVATDKAALLEKLGINESDFKTLLS